MTDPVSTDPTPTPTLGTCDVHGPIATSVPHAEQHDCENWRPLSPPEPEGHPAHPCACGHAHRAGIDGEDEGCSEDGCPCLTWRPLPAPKPEGRTDLREVLRDLHAVMIEVIDLGGVGHEDEDCPQDDTCECALVGRVNRACRAASLALVPPAPAPEETARYALRLLAQPEASVPPYLPDSEEVTIVVTVADIRGARAALAAAPEETTRPYVSCTACGGSGKEGTGTPSAEGGEDFRACWRCDGTGVQHEATVPESPAAPEETAVAAPESWLADRVGLSAAPSPSSAEPSAESDNRSGSVSTERTGTVQEVPEEVREAIETLANMEATIADGVWTAESDHCGGLWTIVSRKCGVNYEVAGGMTEDEARFFVAARRHLPALLRALRGTR